MATIEEDYVSFETAKLLKEKGFNEPCLKEYYNNGVLSDITIEAKYNTIANQISAPTIQGAIKWLRKVHNIHTVIKIVIRTYGNTEYYYELYGTKNGSLCVVCDIYKGESWDSSEKASDEAIKYCLENLI